MQVQYGTVIKYVERHCHVVIIHVSKFVMLVLVERVLALGRGPVHVRNQSFHYPVQKMYQLVEIAVTKYLSVESIGVHSVATEVPVKHADKKWKSSVAVENIQSECHVTSLIFVKLSVLRCGTVKSINVGESVALETVRLVIKIVDGLWDVETINVHLSVIEAVAIHVQKL